MSRDTLTVEPEAKTTPLTHTTPEEAVALLKSAAELDEFRGQPLVDMFAKFQQGGILIPPKAVDLYIRDNAADTGIEPSTGPFWDSPDIWVRNLPDGKTAHQSAVYMKDNWVYVRVHNRGSQTAMAFVVTFTAKKFLGIEFTKADFTPVISAAMGFNVPAGGTQIVAVKWPAAQVPKPVAGTTHDVCLLCQVQPLVASDPTQAGAHVWDSNNLAQKNVNIVYGLAGDLLKVPFQIGNLFRVQPEMFRLEVMRPEKWANVPIALVNPDAKKMEGIFKATGAPADFLRHDGEITTVKTAFHLAYHPGVLAGFPVTLPAKTLVPMELQFTVPKDAKPGEVIELHVVQRNRANQIVGGIAVQVNVVTKR